MREKRKKLDSFKITMLSVLIASVAIFETLTAFRMPPMAISLVPVTLGAIFLGLEGGIALGVTFGIASTVWGLVGDQAYASAFFDLHWLLSIIIYMTKAVGAGVVSALVFKGLKNINKNLALVFSSLVAPIVNTAIFLLGTPFYISTIETLATQREETFGKFILNGIVFENFVPELIINILLVLLFSKLILIFRKKYKREKRRIKRNDKYSVVFFDLDGTVADSGEGVTNSVIYALEKFGMTEARENTKRFIGPPLAHSFKEFYGFDEEKTALAIKYYREYYKEKGIYECYLYDGMRALLSGLKKRGYKIVLCTSKPEDYAHRVLQFLEVDKYFDIVCGATMDEKTRATKEDVMSYAMMTSHATPSTTLMIGDRHFDISSANYFGLDSIGVTFGYGSKEELKNAGATYIANSCEEIMKLLF